MIIAVGVSALVGILTSLDGVNRIMYDNFAELGASTFVVKNRIGMFSQEDRVDFPEFPSKQVEDFKSRYRFPGSMITGWARATGIAVIKRNEKKTNPNVLVVAADEQYLAVKNKVLAEGRNFSKVEINNGVNVVILGIDVLARLARPTDSTIIGSNVSIGNIKYKVVGVLDKGGASQISTDNMVIIPYKNAERVYPNRKFNYEINVMLGDVEELDAGIAEAEGILRLVRKLKVSEDNNFEITKSDKLVSDLNENLKEVRIATFIISGLTLLGAGIALMNILLVAVNERTREIGISKAIGATKDDVLYQFLIESIVICQLGGAGGILLGIIIGNLVGLTMNTGFIMPWLAIFLGVSFCFVIGVTAGLFPAIKARSLNPVEALRFE